ncbi:uncharacterized protein LY89DRAFT_320013 [Mollisia scopiformis]|uniref:Uncharacterized protein n=1 Tax=Mollisia scopiformis TaxID=149040 RepID=A0A132B9L9_MOLSC|nr:uncharacterized protein LY89DRAFT_320013 [Mollisia scopiformis]KUJ09102.1 hypothetical protein LY89DRAFT_320013 [Mollisia scopiformis]
MIISSRYPISRIPLDRCRERQVSSFRFLWRLQPCLEKGRQRPWQLDRVLQVFEGTCHGLGSLPATSIGATKQGRSLEKQRALGDQARIPTPDNSAPCLLICINCPIGFLPVIQSHLSNAYHMLVHSKEKCCQALDSDIDILNTLSKNYQHYIPKVHLMCRKI